MITFNDYCHQKFGEKIYKIVIDAGFTCPNRDGTIGSRGCIFCSAGGSGEFAARGLPVEEQIEKGKKLIADKYRGTRFITYFQAFTNTYAPVEKLEALFFPVAAREDIAAIDIGTRPDCLEPEIMEMLGRLNKVKPVIVELGLQTIHAKTAEYIRRGYSLEVYDDAIKRLNNMGIHTVTHIILGLPGENKTDMLETVRYAVERNSAGIKLQVLNVLKGTDLERDYEDGKFEALTLEEYTDILKSCLAVIGDKCVVHRLTGDGPKKILIAPSWTGNKKHVLNYINRRLEEIMANEYIAEIMTEAEAREVCSWKYPGELAVYNFSDWDECIRKGWDIADEEGRKKGYYSVKKNGEFIAFFHIMDKGDHIELGVGMKPEIVGKHNGAALMELAVSRIKELHPGKPIFLTVRMFNARAVTCYEHAGFKVVEEIHDEGMHEQESRYLMEYMPGFCLK